MPEPDNSKGPDLPIISIYILAHKVGDLQQPVVYVRRRCLNDDNQQSEVTVSDRFIDTLTNDSIIVQIPYLQQHARNHLERLLSVFDQHYCLAADDHLLNIDDAGMSDDERLLLFRLAIQTDLPHKWYSPYASLFRQSHRLYPFARYYEMRQSLCLPGLFAPYLPIFSKYPSYH